MGTVVAFLSGKGGSGKTTLALSIADLMRLCDVKTLLVDCDLSTNGATYFFETQLIDQNKNGSNKVDSFEELMGELEGWKNVPNILTINECVDFIPSVTKFTDHQTYISDNSYEDHIEDLIYWARQNYGIVLLDCQAGYTNLLKYLLPLVDVDLFVLEADSISASALRSLHLKIGNHLGNASLYQVFNKATREEYQIYSKITGTFFVNIGTILFDWKVRQAFSRSQIPDIENTSSEFGEEIFNICSVMLKNKIIQESLDNKRRYIQYISKKKNYEVIQEKYYNIRIAAKKTMLSLTVAISVAIVLMFFSSLILINNYGTHQITDNNLINPKNTDFLIEIVLFGGMIGLIPPVVGLIISKYQKRRDELKALKNEMNNNLEQMEELKEGLKTYMKPKDKADLNNKNE